jgi:hypothetical protein
MADLKLALSTHTSLRRNEGIVPLILNLDTRER